MPISRKGGLHKICKSEIDELHHKVQVEHPPRIGGDSPPIFKGDGIGASEVAPPEIFRHTFSIGWEESVLCRIQSRIESIEPEVWIESPYNKGGNQVILLSTYQ